MTREEIIKKIIRYEWEMFQKVNEGGFRAPCQESPRRLLPCEWHNIPPGLMMP